MRKLIFTIGVPKSSGVWVDTPPNSSLLILKMLHLEFSFLHAQVIFLNKSFSFPKKFKLITNSLFIVDSEGYFPQYLIIMMTFITYYFLTLYFKHYNIYYT